MSNAYFYSKFLLTAALTLGGAASFAQGLINDGAKINLTAGTYLNVTGANGGFTNRTNASTTADVVNAGIMRVQGDWVNNDIHGVFGTAAAPTATTGGLVLLDGADQDITGNEETHFFDLETDGTDVKTLAGASNGATVHGVVTLNDQSLVLNEKVLTVENSNTGALVSIGDGYIISETTSTTDDYSTVRWNIGTNTGAYTVPFGTSPTAANPLEDIAFVYDIQDAGTPASPYRTFATYPTDDGNTFATYAPFSVNHLTDDFGTDNGVSVIDRFWIIDQTNTGLGADGIGGNVDDPEYTDQPTVYYTFKYSDADFNGNSITPSQLTPQRYNHDENKWLDWLYANPQFTNTPGSNTLTMTIGADANTWEEDMYPIWTLVDNSDPLPIELVRFVGQCDGDNITVRWTTWTETNNEFFTLERSTNGVDFEMVDIVDGAGNSNQPISYEITDYNSFPGTSYYRLKDTDTFGKEGYSSVIAVSCGEGSNEFNFVNAYEADQTDVVVEFTAENNEKFNVMLYDMTGRIALDYSGAAVSGMNKVRLPAGDLARGIYIINLNNEIKNFSRRVMLN